MEPVAGEKGRRAPLWAGVAAALLVVTLVVALATGLPGKGSKPEPVVEPTQLPAHGGPLTAGDLDSSCYATDATLCGGNGISVLGVDVRRSRFLVVWIESLTREEQGVETLDKVVARFVSRTGRVGPKVMLAGNVPAPDSQAPLSVRYQPRADLYVVGWNRRDHFLSADTLVEVAQRRRSSWRADHVTRARDPNVRIWGYERGQLGRLPKTGLGLAIWDENSGQVYGQVVPPGKTCRGLSECEPVESPLRCPARFDRSAWRDFEGPEPTPAQRQADGLVKCGTLDGMTRREVRALLGRHTDSFVPRDWSYVMDRDETKWLSVVFGADGRVHDTRMTVT